MTAGFMGGLGPECPGSYSIKSHRADRSTSACPEYL